MTASKQITRHAVHIQAHRLLIQQLIFELRTAKPRVIEEIYERISTELQSSDISKSKPKRAFDYKVEQHIAELLSGAQLRSERESRT